MTIYVENGKVNPYLYLIDTNMFSVSESSAVYLIDGGSEYAIFDTGTSDTKITILRTLKQWNINLERIKYLIPSHWHFDHAAGIPFLLKKLPNAKVYASRNSAEVLRDPTEHVERVRKAFGAFVGKVEPFDEITVVKEGDLLEIGDVESQVLETPGHTEGDISLNILRKEESETLLCGCAIGNIELETNYAFPNSWPVDFNHEKSSATIKRIVNIDPEYLGVAHFGVAQGNHVKTVLKVARNVLHKFRTIIEEEYPKTSKIRPVFEKVNQLYKDNEKFNKNPLKETTLVSLIIGYLKSLGLRD